MKKLVLISLLLFTLLIASSQNCSNFTFRLEQDISASCFQQVMTMRHDRKDRPYLYAANKEAGLVIHDITDIQSPIEVSDIPTTMLHNLEVMNVTQQDNYLFLALGNIFSGDEAPGMAIIDVSDPDNPVVTDVWNYSDSTSGAGIVKVVGDYAYLGAMEHGLIVLDIANKNAISFVSIFTPANTYPDNPDPQKVNARGMEVKNDVVYLSYDAGGFRTIDVSNKSKPVQLGQYANPVYNGRPRAYNNVVLKDTLAYVTVDYCGLEVLNVKDPANITLAGWWNPWNCPNNNWFASVGHTNEIAFDSLTNSIFMSTGKSDLYVVDVSNPTQPDSCNFYGGVNNDIGTWGVSRYDNQVYLSYICVPLGVPVFSNWSGIKILTYDHITTTSEKVADSPYYNIYPNPVSNELIISGSGRWSQITITDVYGKVVKSMNAKYAQEIKVDVTGLDEGIYFVSFDHRERIKFVKHY